MERSTNFEDILVTYKIVIHEIYDISYDKSETIFLNNFNHCKAVIVKHV